LPEFPQATDLVPRHISYTYPSINGIPLSYLRAGFLIILNHFLSFYVQDLDSRLISHLDILGTIQKIYKIIEVVNDLIMIPNN
jgi:hypothetical protein